ncbi:hypothetical protein WA577_003060, partial [Blastocystis sp. JDR]
MDNTQEDIRYRGTESTPKESENTEKTQETKPVPKEVSHARPEKKERYNVEKDPKYRCLFISLKLIIVVLSLISFAIIYFNWIAPLFVSQDEKLGYLKERLIENFCGTEECTPESWEAINKILEKARRG